MRTPFLLLVLLATAGAASAQVLRCTDAQGHTLYTEGACPSGARPTRTLAVPESAGPDANDTRAAQEQLASVERARALQQDSVKLLNPPGRAQTAAPSTVINARGTPATNTPLAAPASSEPPLGEPAISAGTWYPGDFGYGRLGPHSYTRPTRMRHCDANGCQDNLGSHYNREGRIDRYQRADGSTCRLINSMQICR